jgi:MinD-like ATPase involved in chromosome partitioning or flagellar assembly
MTERSGKHFDDQATPPQPPAEVPENSATDSGPLPLGSTGDSAAPTSSEGRWGPPPPLGGTPFTGGQGSEAGNDAPYQWPDQPGGRHVPPSEESTAVVDSAKVPVPEWMRDRADAPRPDTPQWRPAGEQQYGPPPTGQFGNPPFGQPPLDAGRAPERRGPAHGAAPGSSGPAGASERPAGSWQQAPAPQPAPTSAWGEEGQSYSQAQGSAANWNYVDSIRSSELVPTRRIPPGRGWRKALYVASFKLINLGQSPDERYQAELESKIRSLLRGRYKIGILGKGGVGKSTVSASVGSVFAELRQDDRVVAIDADTAFGKLASRIDPSASGSYWELAADRHLFSFGDIRSRVGSNKSGLFVLAGESATARRRVLDAAIYREATVQLDKHFTLSIVDCGSTLDSPVTQEVLTDVDALIVVSSPWYDGASAAGQTLEWLANGGFTGLLHRTVVVINDSDGHANKRDKELLMERFSGRGQKVIEMPFDEHLRPGGVIDVREELNPLTRRRLMELAAACAEHFAATADRPRGV